MNRIVLLFLIIPMIGNTQIIEHDFFGIKLGADWYTLTNYSGETYWEFDNDPLNAHIPWIITGFEYSHDKIDKDFFNIGFQELLLGFERENQGSLSELSPEFFLARKTFKNRADYLQNHQKDLAELLQMIKSEFGLADLNMVRDEFEVYNWDKSYYQISLTCRLDEQMIMVMYTK